MDQIIRNILFIDDHSQQYLASLEIAAKASGFNLFSADNVIEGLDFLEDYDTAIDAIILDLGFPKGEMQGIEALQKIKKKHEHLPVIMLTDSDSAADIDKVVQCMKKGAYNYVGKKTLNPVYLFQLVENALQQNSLLTYAKAANKSQAASETFFTVFQDFIYGRFCKRALFGFELSSVNKPADEKEEITLKQNAIDWHENLFKSIFTPFRDSLQINLKYIAENGTLKCRIIISIFAEDDEKLKQRIADTHHDVKIFFNIGNGDKKNPYLFECISDEHLLKNALDFTDSYKYNLFYRNPIKAKSSGIIGFNNSSKNDKAKNLGKIPLYQPNEVFSIPSELSLGNELFRALSVQQEYTEIDVQLMPKHLMIEEVDFLKQIAKNPSMIQNSLYNQKEIEWFIDYLNKFVLAANDKFIISVLLKRKGGQLQQHIKTTLQNHFFGSAQVQSNFRDADKLMRFKTEVDADINRLPFFYSQNQVIQAFRLPMPDCNILEGINVQPASFIGLPKNLSQNGTLLGEKKNVNGTIPIKISEEALARHLYIMGQTGTGKSTLLKTMILDCLKNNEGFAVIDPHGDLFDEVLKLIPKAKRKKLYILNPMDIENSMTINPLQFNEEMPGEKSLVINELIRAFGTLYDMKESGGPMFESYFKNGLLLLMDDGVQRNLEQYALSDLIRIFQDTDFRNLLLKESESKSVKNFFKTALASTGEQAFANFALYVTSKLTRFVEDHYLSPLITGKKKNIDFRKLMDEGNILLVKMDKGLIGTDNTTLLGQLVLGNIIKAAMSRTSISINERKPYNIFIDEFQNFIKSDAGTALSEVRKYGLRLILANQTLGQLDDFTIQSLMGNVGSLIFFRPGINDYEKIKHFLEPEFKREDVLKLPNFNCIARLLIENIPSEPFVFQTIKD